MKYDVCIGYNHFVFDNSEEAMIFAETAKKHYLTRGDGNVDVTIELVKEEEV